MIPAHCYRVMVLADEASFRNPPPVCCSSRCSSPAAAAAAAPKRLVRRRRRRRRRRTSRSAQFDDALAEQKASLKAQGQTFPEAGLDAVRALKTNIVDLLVQQAELEQEAEKLGHRRHADRGRQAARRDQEAVLRRQRDEVPGRAQEAGLHRRADPRQPPGAAARAEALQRRSRRARRAEPDRDRRLLRREPDAVPEAGDAAPCRRSSSARTRRRSRRQIYNQLKAGADFAALAKKYSQDPGSKDKGGKFTATKGSDVPEFDTAVFDPNAKTGVADQAGQHAAVRLVRDQAGRGDHAGDDDAREAGAAHDPQAARAAASSSSCASDWMTKIAKSYCSGRKIVVPERLRAVARSLRGDQRRRTRPTT